MSFTRSHRNDRRRRVIRETIASDSDFAVESARAQRRTRRASVEESSEVLSTGYRDPGYSQAVRRTCQQRLVQLIPIRKGSLAIALTIMWSIWALLLLSHYVFHVRAHATGRSPILFLQLFDLRSPHSIANWMTGQLWTLTAIISWMIYRIRKHKLDDYRAKYRVWILLTVVALFSSFDASTSCLYLLGQSIDGWTRREIGYGGWPLILASYASLVAVLGVRLSGELKPTPSAIAFWFAGLLAWACAALLGTGLLKLGWSQGTIDLTVGGCWLGGVLAVFQAAGIFLRHCYIHAQKRFVERSVMTPATAGFQMPKMPWSRSNGIAPYGSGEKAVAATEPKRSWLPWGKRDQGLDDEDEDEDDEGLSATASRTSSKARSAAEPPAEPKRPMRLFGLVPSRQECNEELVDDPIREDAMVIDDSGLTKKPGWFGLGGNKNATPEVRTAPKTEQKTAPKPTLPTTQTAQPVSAKSRWLPSIGRGKSTDSKSTDNKSKDNGASASTANTKSVKTNESAKTNPSSTEPVKSRSSWFGSRKSTDSEKSKDNKPTTAANKPATSKPSTNEPASNTPPKRKLASKLSGWFDGLKLKPPVDSTSEARPTGQGASSQSQSPKPISSSGTPLPSTQAHQSEEDDDSQVDFRNLSKAERKRLRRQQGNDRNAA